MTLPKSDKSEVMRWMIDGQLGRRNLSSIQRVAVTEKYRPVFEEKAKENQGTRNDLNIPPNSGASDIKIRNHRQNCQRLIKLILVKSKQNFTLPMVQRC